MSKLVPSLSAIPARATLKMIDLVMVAVGSPSSAAAAIAVWVTVWAVDQLLAVNVRYRGDEVTWVVAELVTERVTGVVGCVARATVKVPVVPASAAVTAAGEMISPADWA